MRAYRTDAAFVRAVARMDTSVDAATALVTLDRLIMEARALVRLNMRRAQAWIKCMKRTKACTISRNGEMLAITPRNTGIPRHELFHICVDGRSSFV